MGPFAGFVSFAIWGFAEDTAITTRNPTAKYFEREIANRGQLLFPVSGYSWVDLAYWVNLRVRRLLCSDRRRWQQKRLLGHDDPRNRIRQEADHGHTRHDQPNHTHERDVDVAILRESEAHARDLAS